MEDKFKDIPFEVIKKIAGDNPEIFKKTLKTIKKAESRAKSIHAIKQFLMLPCFGVCVLGVIFLAIWLFPQVLNIAFFNTTFGTLVFMVLVIAIASIPITFIHRLLFPNHYSPK